MRRPPWRRRAEPGSPAGPGGARAERLYPQRIGAFTFYYDLGSPYAYLTAERIDNVLPEPPTWQPLSLGGIFKLTGRSSWGLSDQRDAGMAEVERRAERYGLPPMRWPGGWPGHYLMAMRAATFAFRKEAGREYTMSAFRLAFREGRDLSDPRNVLEAAERAGLDAREVEQATQDPEIKEELKQATEEAHERGVFGVPTVAVNGELFWGDDRLEEAAAKS